MQSEARLVAITHSQPSMQFLLDGFQEIGYTVKTLNGIEQATRYLQANDADLILLDSLNDSEEPIKSLQALRREWAREALPVIVLTGADCDQIVQLLEAGANDFVLKPPTVPALASRIQTALSVRERGEKSTEAERQRVMSESLARASAAVAVTVGSMVDQFEALMHHPSPRRDELDVQLNGVLEQMEQSVAMIDRLRQISVMKNVPSAARQHLLDQLSLLNC